MKNSTTSSLLYGIVVGGGEDDPAPDQSNNLRVYCPSIHGKDVNFKHLAFSPRLISPDRAGMQSFVGGLDYGSLVVVYKDTGSNQCQILGLANDLNNYESGIPGNLNLMNNPIIANLLNRSMGVFRPPTIQETTQGGAKVFKIDERGDHNHNLLKGLPTHGALFPLNGIPIDPIKGINTAIQPSFNIPGLNVITSLPGIAMSLGSLLNKILSNANMSKQLKNSMPISALNAAISMSTLVQSIEQSESSGFMTSGRVNEEVYMENAVELLKQCTNVSDVISATTRLQSDTSLFGLEEFGPTVVEEDTPFGKIMTSYSASGEQIKLTPASVAQGISTLTNLMSGSGFPSSVPGQNLFGNSSGTILNMIQRLPSGDATAAIGLLNQLNTSGVAQKLHSMFEKVAKGGNPIDDVG